MAGTARFAFGTLVLLAPGVALVWAFFPQLDWAKRTVLAVVLALTVVPGLVFIANAVAGVAVSTASFGVAAVLVVGGAAAYRLVRDPSRRNV